jgi:large subunit ribosomal protein L35
MAKKVKKVKLKSKRSACKRFKITGSGRVKHRHSNRSHILTKKSSKRKSHLNSLGMVDKSDQSNVKRMLIQE